MNDYPLSEKIPSELRSPTGRRFDEITLDALLEGAVTIDDLRVTGEALERQAEIATSVQRPQLAANLRRAAELVPVPEQKILAIYNALRPGRASPEELVTLAAELEEEWNAPCCASLVREAAVAARRD